MIYKKIVIFLLLSCLYLFAFDLKYKGFFSINQNISQSNNQLKSQNIATSIELKKTINNHKIQTSILLLKNDNKDYFLLNEIFLKLNLESYELFFGKNIYFWGALEAYNISDIFNNKNLLVDDNYKLGALNIAYRKFFENNSITFLIKLKEEERNFPDDIQKIFGYPYDSNLNNNNKINLFLKYDIPFYNQIQGDLSIILQNGYNNQRYLNLKDNKIKENLYLVNKLVIFSTIIYKNIIYKFEFEYADSKDNLISDFFHLGVGVEKNYHFIKSKKDLSLILEYYYYNKLHNYGFDDMYLNQIFQNDLFLGLRFDFNNFSSSKIKSGFTYDLEYKENSFLLEYEKKLLKNFLFKTKLIIINPNDNHNTYYKKLNNNKQIKLQLYYYF